MLELCLKAPQANTEAGHYVKQQHPWLVNQLGANLNDLRKLKKRDNAINRVCHK
jgi:hypothetical protein